MFNVWVALFDNNPNCILKLDYRFPQFSDRNRFGGNVISDKPDLKRLWRLTFQLCM